MSQSGVVSWSNTATSNATADSNVNWAEGQAPSTVNDSARQEMASVAKWRDDISGLIVAGGTSTAYSFTSHQTFSTLGYLDGNRLCVGFNTTNGSAATLNVDTLGAKALQLDSTTALPAAYIRVGGRYDVSYNSSGGYFLVHNEPGILTAQVSTSSTITGGAIVGSSLSTSGNLKVTGGSTLTGTVTTGGALNVTSGFAVAAGSVTFPAASIANAALVSPTGLARLASTSTAGASMAFTSTQGLSTTYRSYRFEYDNVVPVTDNVSFVMQFDTDGGASYDTTGYLSTVYAANPGAAGQVGSTDGIHLNGNGVSNVSSHGISGFAIVSNPFTSSHATQAVGHSSYLVTGAGSYELAVGAGALNTTTAVNAVRFLFSSGNISSGRITMYGMTNS